MIQKEINSFNKAIESSNVAELLTEDELTKIGQEVVDDYQADKDSRKEWEKRYESCLKLAAQVVEEKTFPWPGAANIKFPLLTTACLQFSSRAYPALISPAEAVKCRVNGFDDTGEKEAKAIRVGKHMSYQVLEQMEEWEEDMDRLLVMLPITGTEFKKTYFDPAKGRNVSCLVMAKDLVVNYWATSLETAARKTHVFNLYKNEIEERKRWQVYSNVELNEPSRMSESPVSDRIQGQEDINSPDSPYKILEQHRFLDLDGDGYKEPWVVTVEKESKKILRIVARFGVDDVIRKDGEIIYIKPVEYFTKFSFIPSLDGGFYDIGFGHLLGPINETINSTINQLLDSGTLANMNSGFLARGIRLKGGNQNFTLGEWKVVESSLDDLRKGVYPLPVREPSSVLFQLLGTMITSGEKMSAVTDILLGENPGQNQPATTTLAVIEQGLKVFTAINKRLYRALKREYRKLFRLNGMYLEEKEYFKILDPGKEQVQMIQRSDYEGDSLDVVPYADPNIVSETQRIKRAEALVASLGAGSPANPLEIWKRYYEAIGVSGIDNLLPKEMPQQPPDPKLMKIQLDSMDRKYKYMMMKIDLDLKAQKTRAEIMNLQANSILAIAKAEGEEKGQQIELYQMQLDRLAQTENLIESEAQRLHELMMQENETRLEGGNNGESGGLQSMEGASGNGGSIQDIAPYTSGILGGNGKDGRRPYSNVNDLGNSTGV